jgi:hypothetical protein
MQAQQIPPDKGFSVAIAIDNEAGKFGEPPGGSIMIGLSNLPGRIRLKVCEGCRGEEKAEVALLILSRDEAEAVISALHAEMARMDGL